MFWYEKLAKLAEYFGDYPDLPEPAFLYEVAPPENISWPEEIPANDELKRYFDSFGGGTFGPQMTFFPLERITKQTASWFNLLKDDEEFLSQATKDLSVNIASDPDGAPWWYHTGTREVSLYYWKSGQWIEPQFASLGEFVDYVFKPSDDDDDWRQVLEQSQINA